MNQVQRFSISAEYLTCRALAIVHFGLFSLCFLPLLLSESQVQAYESVNYLLIFFLAVFRVLLIGNRRFLFLSPVFLLIAYVSLNNSVGAFFYKNGFFDDYLLYLLSFQDVQHKLLVYNAFLLVSVLSLGYTFKSKGKSFAFFKSSLRKEALIAYGLGLMLVFSKIEFELTALGAQGSMSAIPKSIGAILIIITASGYKTLYRLPIYFFVLLMMSAVSFEDKRQAILLILTIGFIEFGIKRRKVGFASIMSSITVMIAGFFLIVAMSIKRGYGSYEGVDNQSVLNLISYVPRYVSEDFFLQAIANNLEISYAYVHSSNGLNIAIEDPDIFLFGSTFLKPAFLFIPRFVYPNKPRSMIDQYTRTYSPGVRARGISHPVNLYVEFFWNFRYLGILLIFPCFVVINTIYDRFLCSKENLYMPAMAVGLFMLNQWVVFIRGSGLELAILDLVFSIIFLSPIIIYDSFINQKARAK